MKPCPRLDRKLKAQSRISKSHLLSQGPQLNNEPARSRRAETGAHPRGSVPSAKAGSDGYAFEKGKIGRAYVCCANTKRDKWVQWTDELPLAGAPGMLSLTRPASRPTPLERPFDRRRLDAQVIHRLLPWLPASLPLVVAT